MNRITNEERERIYDRAAELVRDGHGIDGIADRLATEFGISRERARQAAARAIRRARHS